jgi:hypothetical protein
MGEWLCLIKEKDETFVACLQISWNLSSVTEEIYKNLDSIKPVPPPSNRIIILPPPETKNCEYLTSPYIYILLSK